MCPGTLPRKFEIEGESTSHPFVDRCGSFATWVGVLPCVEDVSARATALRAVGQAQSQFICAWGGLLSLLAADFAFLVVRCCLMYAQSLKGVCSGVDGYFRGTDLRCGLLVGFFGALRSAGESASLPSADKCGIIGLRFATRVLGFRRASKMSHPQTAGAPIIGVQASV